MLTIPQYTPTPEPQIAATVVEYPNADIGLFRTGYALSAGKHEASPVRTMSSSCNGHPSAFSSDREYYKLELIVPTVDGKETVNVYQRSTAWRVPEDLFPPDTVTDRACSWRVSVVRLVTERGNPTYKVISQTVKRRTFTWNVAQP